MNYPPKLKSGVYILSVLFASGTLNATTITTVPYWNGTSYVIPELGESIPGNGAPVAIWGQTFTVPDDSSVLNNFSVWMENITPNPLLFDGSIMQWTGQHATGPVLYQSGSITLAQDVNFHPVSFDQLNLALTPGQQYVFLFSVANNQDGLDRRGRLSSIATDAFGNPFDAYTGGGIGYVHSVSGLTQDWGAFVPWDTAFIADFSSPEVSVPETTNAGLLVISAGFLGFVAIRRKHMFERI